MSRSSARTRARSVVGDRKRWSQNFLVDPTVAEALVRAAGVGSSDLVVEIGSGDGMVTGCLVGLARQVLAVEIDPRYVGRLRRRFAGVDGFACRLADFHDVEPPGEPFAVVANVPFTGSTDVVRWCLDARALTSATLLTQREFARKHSGDYGRWSKLTVTHWPHTAFELGMTVPRDRFRPVPGVDAAVLRLRRRDRPLVADAARYRRVVECGFSGVGGSLAASLGRMFAPRRVRVACERAGIAPDAPVGVVSPGAWLRLYQALV